jgi:hypothetical protein
MVQNESPPLPSNFRVLKRRNGKLIRSPPIKMLVGVGEAQEEFMIHKNIITAKSSFFRSALSGRWNNFKSGTVNLEQFDPRYFSIYLHTVYTNDVALPGPLDYMVTYQELAETYVIAEEMIDWRAENLMVGKMKDLFRVETQDGMLLYPRGTVISTIYNGTSSAASQARRLVVKIWSATAGKEYVAKYGSTLPQDFLVELCCEMSAQRGVGGRTKIEGIETDDFMETDPEEKELEGKDDGDGP